MSSPRHPTALVILDGFGYSTQKVGNAIALAATPHLDAWMEHYPWTTISATSAAVGLLPGQLSNSEVGHLTIGAGRVVPQMGTVLHKAIQDRSLFMHPLLLEAFERLRENGKALHLIGLLSDVGVHAHTDLLYAILEMASLHGVPQVYIHAILDGRDVAPYSAQEYLEELDYRLKDYPRAHLSSLHGRFYAMDRDRNWERTRKSYEILTQVQLPVAPSWLTALTATYHAGTSEEFMPPVRLNPHAVLRNGDSVLFTNFRPDRARQLTQAFVDESFDAFPVNHALHLSSFVTPIRYSETLTTDALYEYPPSPPGLVDTIDAAGLSIFAVAETEKYAHVTYFFNQLREQKHAHETRVLIPSAHVTTFAEQPQMSAAGITDAVLESLAHDPCDFYLINYANADMVGHSGNLEATIKAVECLDRELGRLYDALVIKQGGSIYITADHGNAEEMLDEKGDPKTSHTNNPVIFLALSEPPLDRALLTPLKGLADVAPFVLQRMGLKSE